MSKHLVREAVKARNGKLTGSRMDITIITPGWGTSGHYSETTLEQAATDLVFPAGTQMHMNHQSAEEREQQPAGDVNTLAAVLLEDAVWDPDWTDPETGVKGRLRAPARVFNRYREHLVDVAEVIGTSIVAPAEVSMGEAEGRQGRIIETLLPSKLNRVDFVTVAGRGGRISEVMEAAATVQEARNIGAWMEARMHSMFTSIADEFYGDGRLTREERIALSSGLGDALVAFTATIEATAPQLFERDLWEDPTAQEAAAGAPKESPSDPAGANRKETPVGHIQIEESEHATLIANSSRATALESDLGTATAALQEVNDAAATALVAGALEAAGVTAPKLAERLAKGYPIKENGALDAEGLAEAVAESIAELQVAGGAGTVRTVGETTAVENTSAPKHTKADVLSVLEGGK